jgi:LemA protein
MAGFYILAGIILVIVIGVVAIYNRLITLRNQVNNGWAQIDVQLKRRHDLIPNLVEIVKGYARHERETLESVTRLRGQAMSASGPNDAIPTELLLTAALGKLFALVEAYPDLKANQNFLALQEELSSTENKIGFARQYYNDEVMKYTNQTQVFPSNVVSSMFQFAPYKYFELEHPGEAAVPKLELD